MGSSADIALRLGCVAALLATLFACDDAVFPGRRAAVPAPDCEDGTDLTWDNFGKGFITSWCLPCHSVNLVSPETGDTATDDPRSGAPMGVNFDTLADVQRQRDLIIAFATTAAPLMPPAGGTRPEERDALEEWLECEAPGEGPADGDCASPTPTPGTTISSQAAADTLCAHDLSIEGDLILTGAGALQLNCVCSISGSVIVEGSNLADVGLRNMAELGGDLVIRDNASIIHLDAVALSSIGGDLEITENAKLLTFELAGLRDVGGAVTVTDNALLSEVDVGGVRTIGAGLEISRNPVAKVVDVGRVTDIGGDLRFEGMSQAWELDPASLVNLGGDLIVTGNDTMVRLNGFLNLLTVDGAIEVNDNASLSELHGLVDLPSLPNGHLHIKRNPALDAVRGFTQLVDIGYELEITDNPVLRRTLGFFHLLIVGHQAPDDPLRSRLLIQNNPGMLDYESFRQLAFVGELQLIDNESIIDMTFVTGFNNLREVVGELRIEGHTELLVIYGFNDLTAVHDVRIVDNPKLDYIGGYNELTTIQGDLVLRGNEALRDPRGFNLLRTVGAYYRIIDNDRLVQLRGLPSLENVVLDFEIADNDSLAVTEDWRSLTRLGTLRIHDNASLTDLRGFGMLSSTREGLFLYRNGRLPTLRGLDQMTDVGSTLSILDHPELVDMTSLLGITDIGNDFRVERNLLLPTSQAELLRDQLLPDNIGGEVVIVDNGPG